MSDRDEVLHLDMDGVKAGFEQWSLEVIGPDWKSEIDQPTWGIYKQYPRLYLALPVLEGAIELYRTGCELYGKDKVILLTALPNRARDFFPMAAADKITWARKFIDPHIRVSFGPFAKDKQYHCRHNRDVLVDDTTMNIDQWSKVGGHGILHSHLNMQATLDNLKQFKKG